MVFSCKIVVEIEIDFSCSSVSSNIFPLSTAEADPSPLVSVVLLQPKKTSRLAKKIIVFIFLLIAFNGYSQNPLQPILKTYFRAHPFDMKFSSFVLSLQKDPWFTTEEYYRRTDTNFFFLSGTYKNFNPFRFTPKELRFVIAEEEIMHTDSLHTHDTIINIQLMAITDTGLVNSKSVEKEFHRFNNNQADRFSSKTQKAG